MNIIPLLGRFDRLPRVGATFLKSAGPTESACRQRSPRGGLARALLLAVTGLIVTDQAFAQGTVNFSDRDLTDGIDAPVFDVDGVTMLGSAFLAQLYWSATGAAGSYVAVTDAPVPFRDGAGVGYWNPIGNNPPSADASRTVGVAAGQPAWLEVAVWNASTGTNYEQASESLSGRLGLSTPIRVVTGGVGTPPSLPAPLSGLQSFSLYNACLECGVRISSSPMSQTVAVGATVVLSVAATGLPRLDPSHTSYQWERQEPTGNWQVVQSGVKTNLALTDLQLSTAGNYRVIVITGDYPPVTSAIAQIKAIVPPRLGAAVVSNGLLRFNLEGAVGDIYHLQFTSDLVNWITLQTLTNTAGAVSFATPPGSNWYQFYRVQAQ